MAPDRSRSLVRLLLPLFLFSGASGLVYQVVWMRMLTRVFGITLYAVSTIVAVFMLGLALGSAIAGRALAHRAFGLLRTYAVLEIAIGLLATASTLLIPRLPEMFHGATAALGDAPSMVVLLRAVLVSIVLLPPTIAMGATLPLLSQLLAAREGDVGRSVGLLYGANTLGAVAGVLSSGLLLLMAIGERGTVYLGAAINAAVGALALALDRKLGKETTVRSDAHAKSPTPPHLSRLLFVYAASGFAALGYEVVWSRILGLILGTSVYAFSSMLGMYLVGIATGSVVMGRFSAHIRRPLLVFSVLELSVAILGLASILVFRAVGLADASPDHVYSQLWSFRDFFRLPLYAGIIVMPVTLPLGAMLPLLTLLFSGDVDETARSVARLYSWNTIGSIFGSLVTGFFLVPALGTQKAFIALTLLSLGLAVFVFFFSPQQSEARPRRLLAAGALVYVAALSFSFQDTFLDIIMMRGKGTPEATLRHVEHAAATVTIVKSNDDSRHLLINGYIVSSTSWPGRLMVHLPLLLHPDPRSLLIVGFGVGESFRTGIDSGVDTFVAELVPAVIDQFPIIWPNDHRAYLESPLGHIVLNDGRNFLLETHRTFDAVLIDGTPPLYNPSIVSLTTLEMMQLVRRHLTPDGIFAFWFPTNCFESDFWTIAHNFTETFPQVGFHLLPNWSGIIMLGTSSTKNLLAPRAEMIFDRAAARPAHLVVDPARVTTDIMAGIKGSDAQIRELARGYPLSTDDSSVIEFPILEFWRGAKYETDNAFVLRALEALRSDAR
jgi:spermidine synthase